MKKYIVYASRPNDKHTRLMTEITLISAKNPESAIEKAKNTTSLEFTYCVRLAETINDVTFITTTFDDIK